MPSKCLPFQISVANHRTVIHRPTTPEDHFKPDSKAQNWSNSTKQSITANMPGKKIALKTSVANRAIVVHREVDGGCPPPVEEHRDGLRSLSATIRGLGNDPEDGEDYECGE